MLSTNKQVTTVRAKSTRTTVTICNLKATSAKWPIRSILPAAGVKQKGSTFPCTCTVQLKSYCSNYPAKALSFL